MRGGSVDRLRQALRREWRCLFTGILCARVVALDVDVTDPELAAEVEALAVARLGRTLRRIGNPPKRLLLYRAAEPIRSRVLPFGPVDDPHEHAVEVLGEGRKFTAIAIHRTTRRAYQWPDGSPPRSGVPLPVSAFVATTISVVSTSAISVT